MSVTPKWRSCHLSVQRQNVDGTVIITHQASVTTGAKPDTPPFACASITMRSVYGVAGLLQRSRTVTASGHCGQQIKTRLLKGNGRNWFFLTIKQTPDSPEERLAFAAEPGHANATAVHRLLPLASEVEALSYIASHADLIATIGDNAAAARQHYAEHGAHENRGIDFDPLRYVASYPDLFPLWPNLAAICRHYIKNGHAEGRTMSFQPTLYFAGYKDLLDKLPFSEYEIVDHYVRSGFSEGRGCAAFDWRDYLARNPALSGKIGTDPVSAATHYVKAYKKIAA